jgi:hypothetical protein
MLAREAFKPRPRTGEPVPPEDLVLGVHDARHHHVLMDIKANIME